MVMIVEDLKLGETFIMPIANEAEADGFDKLTWCVVHIHENAIVASSTTHPNLRFTFQNDEEIVPINNGASK